MAELLLELLSEEIPARMQARAAEDLKRLVTDGLKKEKLTFTAAEAYVTPRRLALVVDGLPEKQPDVVEERKGPRVGAPEKAVNGFLKAAGLDSLDACEVRSDPKKGDYYVAIQRRVGRETSRVLVDVLRTAISKLPWPKSMRWADYDLRWVRPLHGILAVLDGVVIQLAIDRRGSETYWDPDLGTFEDSYTPEYIEKFATLIAGNRTIGHRFAKQDGTFGIRPDPSLPGLTRQSMGPRVKPEGDESGTAGAISVTSFADYKAKLRDAKVMLDPAERREVIRAGAEKAAADAGLSLKPDDGLLHEVAGLVEWPVVLMGRIDEDFMDLLPEVLATSMRAHQKYFSVLDKDGKLAPRFIVVGNIEARDGGKEIIAGNERVLRARLSDAKFFWDQDRKSRLDSKVPKLAERIFHAKLGSDRDRVERLRQLATALSQYVPEAPREPADRAALLCKADLTAEMVGEFPELQGVMGRYYALHDGEPVEIAEAIAEHYSPLGPTDDCPSRPVSVCVALADKIDTLVGFFSIDEKPTGSKDPFALRRAALGVIRLIIENSLRIPLSKIIFESYRAYLMFADRALVLYRADGFENGSQYLISNVQSEFEQRDYDSVWISKSRQITFPGGGALNKDDFVGEFAPHQNVRKAVLDFFADRLKVHLREKGVRHDLVSAVFSLGGEDDLVRLLARVDALASFLGTEDGADLLTAFRRAANIVRIEEKKDGAEYGGDADASLLRQEEETILSRTLGDVMPRVAEEIRAERFHEAMSVLAGLRRPVDAFFDHVTVNCDEPDLRRNRLRLLSTIRSALNEVADFSMIEG